MHTIEAKVIVDAPVHDCYQQWSDFEAFPQFMRRVRAVRRMEIYHPDQPSGERGIGAPVPELLHEVEGQGGQVWHWEVEGPFGRTYSWDAGVVLNMPDKAISWVSTHDQDYPNSGTVNFLKLAPGKTTGAQTLIEVTMTFAVPLGPLGELVDDLLSYGDNAVREALDDFKARMEGHPLKKPAATSTTNPEKVR